MLKRELKINRRGLLIWTLVSLILFFIAYIIYFNIGGGDTANALKEMVAVMPEELLKMFNMDIIDIDTIFGWYKTEGYTFIALIISLYSAILGSNILLKEESEKTIDFLHSKPITRNNIVTAKIISGLINIVIMVVVITLFNIIGMFFSNDLQLKLLLCLSFAPIISALPFFFISMYISTFFKKTSKTNGLGIGIVFISYFLQLIANISNKVNFIKFFSILNLSDGRDIILNNSLNITSLLVSIIISAVSCYAIYIRYNNKELI